MSRLFESNVTPDSVLQSAARHAAGFLMGPLEPKAPVAWENLAGLPGDLVVVGPDLKSISPFIKPGIAALDLDGVAFPAKTDEYRSPRRAFGNSSVQSTLRGSRFMDFLDHNGLSALRARNESPLVVAAVSTSSWKLPRSTPLASFLKAEQFVREVFLGYKRGEESALRSPLGDALLQFFSKILTELDLSFPAITVITDTAHPIPAVASTDSRGRDGVFLNQLANSLRIMTGIQMDPHLAIVNPLIKEPSHIDFGRQAFVPIEV